MAAWPTNPAHEHWELIFGFCFGGGELSSVVYFPQKNSLRLKVKKISRRIYVAT